LLVWGEIFLGSYVNIASKNGCICHVAFLARYFGLRWVGFVAQHLYLAHAWFRVIGILNINIYLFYITTAGGPA
jgi:hypothetical protein